MADDDPRKKAEEITEGTRQPENLDHDNLTIWIAQRKNMLLTNPSFRGVKWSTQMLRTERNIKRLKNKESK